MRGRKPQNICSIPSTDDTNDTINFENLTQYVDFQIVMDILLILSKTGSVAGDCHSVKILSYLKNKTCIVWCFISNTCMCYAKLQDKIHVWHNCCGLDMAPWLVHKT